MGRLRQSIALDALVGALAAATVCGWIITPLTRTFDLPTTQLLVSVALSRVGDVLVIAAVVGVLAVTGGRPGGFYPYLIAGLAIFAVADTIYTYRVAFGTYELGQPPDILWPLGLAVVAHGVWRPRLSGRLGPGRPGLAMGRRLATLVVLGVWTAAPRLHAPYLVILLAAATLLACGGRTLEAFVRVRDLAAVRKQALTDDLTQVGNRRLLYQRTEQALHERAGCGSVALVLLDLDRFKRKLTTRWATTRETNPPSRGRATGRRDQPDRPRPPLGLGWEGTSSLCWSPTPTRRLPCKSRSVCTTA